MIGWFFVGEGLTKETVFLPKKKETADQLNYPFHLDESPVLPLLGLVDVQDPQVPVL